MLGKFQFAAGLEPLDGRLEICFAESSGEDAAYGSTNQFARDKIRAF